MSGLPTSVSRCHTFSFLVFALTFALVITFLFCLFFSFLCLALGILTFAFLAVILAFLAPSFGVLNSINVQ